MNPTLQSWNEASANIALEAMIACCGARRWALAMIGLRPIASVAMLSIAADQAWSTMEEADWLEAFACHPRIGQRKTASEKTKSAEWSVQEQSQIDHAAQLVLDKLAAGNDLYEQRFGFNYIVCANGKTAEEMLAILNRSLARDRATELREAAEQQRHLMQIRLGKWLIE